MAQKRKTKPMSAAIVTIRSPGRMTARGRRHVAEWLRRHADMLMRDGKHYTEGRFTGRYMYAD